MTRIGAASKLLGNPAILISWTRHRDDDKGKHSAMDIGRVRRVGNGKWATMAKGEAVSVE